MMVKCQPGASCWAQNDTRGHLSPLPGRSEGKTQPGVQLLPAVLSGKHYMSQVSLAWCSVPLGGTGYGPISLGLVLLSYPQGMRPKDT